MNNLNIIDQFMQTFSSYIDNGFGLLNGDVVALSSILVGIDMTLAGLFWALDPDADVLARLIKKVLYVGTFAYIINNFQTLATVIFSSFSTLGLSATTTGLTAADLLMPGKLAGTGFTAAWPLLQQAGSPIGFTSVFTHLVIIVVLLIAWFIVIISFFLLAVQLFITVLEYKLTALAGFVLVPFALWNKTSFLAERVLGNVVSSGIKVMVLAVIVGIGDTLFSTFTSAAQGQQPTIAGAMALVLAAITLLGLGIFGPAIATGLVSGAPQLGAGAALGTAGALAGGAMLASGAAIGGARLAGAAASGGLAAVRAGTSMGSAAAATYKQGQGTAGASGMAGVAAGVGGMARAGGGAVMQGARSMAQRAGNAFTQGTQTGRNASGTGDSSASASAPPAWAQRLRSDQRGRHNRQATAQAIKEGDRPGAPANPELDQEE
jgi:type IV secretion system protein TrbL